MASKARPPSAPVLRPSEAPVVVEVCDRLPASADVFEIWPAADMFLFMNQHEDLRRDLVKKKTRGVGNKRFEKHLNGIPRAVRVAYAINYWGAKSGRKQEALCKHISIMLGDAMHFLGTRAAVV